MKTIHIYRADGTHTKRAVQANPGLEELQKIVKGYIEHLTVRHGGRYRTMIMNEEGKILDLPFNAKASAIARRPIVGDVVIL